MFSKSVVSYPKRGPYGDAKYRGNCTGYIIKDAVATYMPQGGLLADPSIGSGTSQDVADELGIRFKGTDLHAGFNLLTDDFGQWLGEPCQMAWWHPPYGDMILYSGEGNMWGDEPNPYDMSQMSIRDFSEALELAVMNIHDAVEPGGVYCVLMGNLRRNGNYYNLSGLVDRLAPGRLIDEIIKVQHNCASDRRHYSGNPIVRIAHEKLLVFRRGNGGALHFLAIAERRHSAKLTSTWKAVIKRTMQAACKPMHLSELYEAIEPYAKTRDNNHWKAKIRQIVQMTSDFTRVDKGVYCIA